MSKFLIRPRAKDPLQLALANELRNLQLKPFKRLHFKFDPFHPRVSSIREFLFNSTTKQVRKTNPKCTFKTDILSENHEPEVICQLENGKTIVFKTANLTLLEIVEHFNHYTNRFTPEAE